MNPTVSEDVAEAPGRLSTEQQALSAVACDAEECVEAKLESEGERTE